MSEIKIPFNRACFEGKELVYIAEAIGRGHISGDGHFSKKCHAFFEEELGNAKALLTTSCTHALEMAAILLDVEPGDEVIVPSFTFVSTANAFVRQGARPVFAEIREDTLNLDENRLEDLVSDRTRAVVPVHYGGVGCEMDAISDIAARRGFSVVEDNAHGLFGKYKGRFLGSFGALATLSFHETKNITCGEGGALLINDPELVSRAEIIREKGTDRGRFYRGEVDKYTWVDVGSSFLPSELLAGFLFAQLEARHHIQGHRRRIWDFYRHNLAEWATAHGVRIPFVPDHCDPSYHLFFLIMPTPRDRDRLIAHLRSRGILSVFHYLPLHLSEMGRKSGRVSGRFEVTESVSSRLVRLPFFTELTEEELSAVVDGVTSYYEK